MSGCRRFIPCEGLQPPAAAPRATKEAISLKQLHPQLVLTTVRCTSCGNTFTTRSTRSEIVTDICSNCHPAYTGRERRELSGGRIERFERRRQLARKGSERN